MNSTIQNEKIAIVGMSCLLPGAKSLKELTKNIIDNSIHTTIVTNDDWDSSKFYSTKNSNFENIYCRVGGFISANAKIDPLALGVMPNSISGSDPEHFLALDLASKALTNVKSNIDKYREQAIVIVARNGAPGVGSLNLIQHGQTLKQFEELLIDLKVRNVDKIITELKQSLYPCNSDTISGVMPNIIAGRIANKFGFEGKTFILDSACASSLIALETACDNLLLNKTNLALVGAVHVNSLPFYYQMFCAIGALSYDESIKPFTNKAIGTILADGIGFVVLKRLSDALTDNDRIYCVVESVTSNSSGRTVGLLAPSFESEVKVIQKAYFQAGIEPHKVSLIEGHGTSTKAGDLAELKAIETVFANSSNIVLSCIKSQIGHCQAASGISGIIKTALCLYHNILPGMPNNNDLNNEINWSKFPAKVISQSIPWISDSVKYAGVNAFGFGGTNSHAILSNFKTNFKDNYVPFKTNITFISNNSFENLQKLIHEIIYKISNFENFDFESVSYSINRKYFNINDSFGVCLISKDINELKDQLNYLYDRSDYDGLENKNIFFKSSAKIKSGKMAFVFPGLGSSYKYMLKDLVLYFPELLNIYEFVDKIAIQKKLKIKPSQYVFSDNDYDLNTCDQAVLILILSEYLIYFLLNKLNIKPDAFCGISTGEYTALLAGQCCNLEVAIPKFFDLSTDLSYKLHNYLVDKYATIVLNSTIDVASEVANNNNLVINAKLSSKRFLLTGLIKDIQSINSLGFTFTKLSNPLVFHIPEISKYLNLTNSAINDLDLNMSQIPIWSACTSTKQNDVDTILKTITNDLLVKPIELTDTINNMVADGFTTFIEVGPRNLTTTFIQDTVDNSLISSLPSNIYSRDSLYQIQLLLANLYNLGHYFNLDYLFHKREIQLIDFDISSNNALIKLNLTYPELKIDKNSESIEIDNLSDNNPSSIFNSNDVFVNYFDTLEKSFKAIQDGQNNLIHKIINSSAVASPLKNEINNSQLFKLENYSFLNNYDKYECFNNGIEIVINLDTTNCIFLNDHHIGHFVNSNFDYLDTLPLMIGLEIMSQAASHTLKSCNIHQITNVKALNKIVIKKAHKIILKTKIINVNLCEVNLNFLNDDFREIEAFKAKFVFNTQTNFSSTLNVLEPSTYTIANKITSLYSSESMFHGPTLQATKSINHISKNRIETEVQISEINRLFKHDFVYSTLINPILLDNATQAALFYLLNTENNIMALLPFDIDSINFKFNDNKYRIVLNIIENNNLYLKANIFLYDSNNDLAGIIINISWRKIKFNQNLSSIIYNLSTIRLSKSIDLPLNDYHLKCSYIDINKFSNDSTNIKWLSDYYFYNSFDLSSKNIIENFKSQIVIKDAILSVLNQNIFPLDIFLHKNFSNKYIISSNVLSNNEIENINFANSNKNNLAIAIASQDSNIKGLGIDLECTNSFIDSSNKLCFTQFEIDFLNNNKSDNMIPLKLWMAKESFSKALGTGLQYNPKKFVLSRFSNNFFNLTYTEDKTTKSANIWTFENIIDDHIISICII